MKTMMIISGTNAVGKSSATREVIKAISQKLTYSELNTYCGNFAFCGKYTLDKGAGVDRYDTTAIIKDAAAEAFDKVDNVIAEGQFTNSFGLNLLNALFLPNVERRIVLCIYAPQKVIYERLMNRGNGVFDFDNIIRKQRQAQNAAIKYKKIGCTTFAIDSSKFTPDQIGKIILEILNGER